MRALFKDIVKMDSTLLSQMDESGQFPLMSAISKEDLRSTALLVECGANVYQTWNNMTPMTRAVKLFEKEKPNFLTQLKTVKKLSDSEREPILQTTQTLLISLGRMLDYPTYAAGICYGYGLMGMQAFLLLDENDEHLGLDEFSKRISFIKSITPEKHLVNLKNARMKIKETGSIEQANLTENEKIAYELPAFYDGIEIYSPEKNHDDLYSKGENPILKSPEPSLELVASNMLEEKKGVSSIQRFSGVYDKKEFSQYIHELKNTFTSPVGLMLGAKEHAIFVGFNPKKNMFVLIDANKSRMKEPILFFNKVEDVEEAVKNVFKLSNDNKIIMRTTLFSSAKDNNVTEKQSRDWMEKMKSIHEVTLEKVNYFEKKRHTLTWAYYAMLQGEVELLNKIHQMQNSSSSLSRVGLYLKKQEDGVAADSANKINELRKKKR